LYIGVEENRKEGRIMGGQNDINLNRNGSLSEPRMARKDTVESGVVTLIE
jgi:hypothetical protein